MIKFLQSAKNAKHKKGFTLVEVIIVLVIIAILAAILIPSLTGYIDSANKKAMLTEARDCYKAVQTALSEVYADAPEKVVADSIKFQVQMPTDFGGQTVSCGMVCDANFGDMQRGQSSYEYQLKSGTASGAAALQTLKYLDSDKFVTANGLGYGEHIRDTSKCRYFFYEDYNPYGSLGYHHLSDIELGTYFSATKHDISITAFFNEKAEIIFFEFAKSGSDLIVKMNKDGAFVEENGKGQKVIQIKKS